MPEKKNGRVIVKVWGLFHDRVGYQIYTQAVANPNFWYDPEGKRWRLENIGECLASYDNEEKALKVKFEVEEWEKAHRWNMLEAFKNYNTEKTILEDSIRAIVKDEGGFRKA